MLPRGKVEEHISFDHPVTAVHFAPPHPEKIAFVDQIFRVISALTLLRGGERMRSTFGYRSTCPDPIATEFDKN